MKDIAHIRHQITVTLDRIERLNQTILRHETHNPEDDLSISQFKRLRQELSNKLYSLLNELGVDLPVSPSKAA